ncbi:hypothetical protein [Methylobacterium dankookense]|uniref:hypothetical protein n=1 Tax=Methylobacterium dankookense TaxID=560405 RepID=UPI0011A56581|nr:hypothetical protein [Methylobacterium dankookense]
MSKVRYKRLTVDGETLVEASAEIGALIFSDRGLTPTEARAKLMHRLEAYRASVVRAVEEARACAIPADDSLVA